MDQTTTFSLILAFLAIHLCIGSYEVDSEANQIFSEHTDIDVQGFRQSYDKRLQLQAKHQPIQVPRQDILLDKYDKWKRRKKSSDDFSSIKTFCVSIMSGCSWEEANLLLNIDASSKANSIAQDLLETWVRPTEMLKKSLPKNGENECHRISKPPSVTEFFMNYVSQSKPVIISNGLSKWKALERWNMNYLNKLAGNEIVKIYTSTDGDFEKIQSVGEWKQSVQATGRYKSSGFLSSQDDVSDDELVMVRPAETEFTFRQYVYLTSNYSNPEKATFYLQKHDLRRWTHNKQLTADISPAHHQTESIHKSKKIKHKKQKKNKKSKNEDGWARFLKLDHYFLWLAKGSTRGPVHYDMNENLYSVIKGSKTFEIFHPTQGEEMYEKIASYRSAHLLYEWTNQTGGVFYSLPISSSESSAQPFSAVNVSHPDYNKYPKYKQARKLTCKLNQGDILYLPSYWWHEVSGEGDKAVGDLSIAINAFYAPYWIKGSDLKHFSRNPYYSYLNSILFDKTLSTKEIKKKLKKVLDIDYWRK